MSTDDGPRAEPGGPDDEATDHEDMGHEEMGRVAADHDRTGRPPRAQTRPRSRLRRHVIVLVIAILGLGVGIALVVAGRHTSTTSTTPEPTTRREPLLRSLGAVPNRAAALALVRGLDPRTLTVTSSVTTTGPGTSVDERGVEATEAGVQRCQQAVAQQNTDRSLGDRLAAARLQVGDKTTFVLSYALPASGSDPAGIRVVLTDAQTCRVLGAVQH